MSKGILNRYWLNFVNSFDHRVAATVECRPFNVTLVVGSFVLIVSICRFVPPIQKVIGLEAFALPVALATLGGVASILTHTAYPNRTRVALFQTLDVPFYGAGFVSLALFSDPDPAQHLITCLHRAGCPTLWLHPATMPARTYTHTTTITVTDPVNAIDHIAHAAIRTLHHA